jgi:hypothetical protein
MILKNGEIELWIDLQIFAGLKGHGEGPALLENV